MAEKEIIPAEGTVKTPVEEVKKDVKVAPEGEKTTETPVIAEDAANAPEAEAATDAPTEDDISDVITLLNEFQAISGGEGEISDIPKELIGVIRFVVGKMVALRDAFQDPLFKKVLDDMVDQSDDGQTPSLLVSIARNAPMEELQDIAENENYSDVQTAVEGRIAGEKTAAEDEEAMVLNFEESQKAGQEYADEMGYDEAEAQRLFSSAMTWFKALGDGKLTKEEWAKVDKADNYDKDTGELRKQLPEAPKKEIMPDQSTMQATMKEQPKKAMAPRNSIETMASKPADDFMQTGRKRFKT